MPQKSSSKIVLKNTAKAVIVPLKNGISSLNRVYEALITAHVDPVTGQCSNYDSIRQEIVQAHQHLKQSEQTASSGLEGLDESLENLTLEERRLNREMKDSKQTIENLKTEKKSNKKILKESQGTLKAAKRNLTTAQETLQVQESRIQNAETTRGVGIGLLLIPVVGWIAGSAMIISSSIELDEAGRAAKEAEEEEMNCEREVEEYEHKVSDYKSKISQTNRDISKKDKKLKQTRKEIQKVNKQMKSVAEFQNKVRSAVHLLSVLSGRASVAEHQTRKFILQEPVMKVMKDVQKAANEITGNKFFKNRDISRLINQMRKNSKRLTAICASEDNNRDYY